MQVFYRPAQSVLVKSSSPSAGKPAQVVADWQVRFAGRIELVSFEPVTREDLCRVHDPAYVEGVFSLERSNGFGIRQADVAESLRYTSGSLRAAALAAWRGAGTTVSPISGFHHARYAGGGGFCTFNGLVLAALTLLDAGAARLAIITGNWGCGAFGGNAELMYLVQWLAADWAGVDELVLHVPRAAEFAAATEKFTRLQSLGSDYADALQFLVGQGYRWGVSDGN